MIVFSPPFAVFYTELKKRLAKPSTVSVSARSTLVITGGGDVTIEGLELDGALEVEVGSISRVALAPRRRGLGLPPLWYLSLHFFSLERRRV